MYLKVKDNEKSWLSITGIGTKLVSRGKVNIRSRGITLCTLLFWNQAYSVFDGVTMTNKGASWDPVSARFGVWLIDDCKYSLCPDYCQVIFYFKLSYHKMIPQ